MLNHERIYRNIDSIANKLSVKKNLSDSVETTMLCVNKFWVLKIEQVNKTKVDDGKIWYLIQTKPNAHLVASKHLVQQNFEVFVPLILKTSKRASKFIDNAVPLFPSYVFIGTKLDPVPWKSINATRGVYKAVTLDGTYRPLRREIIDELKIRCDAGSIIRKRSEILLGDNVRIEKGPFADFVCKVEEIEDNQRIWVLLEIMKRKTRTQVSLNDLSRVD